MFQHAQRLAAGLRCGLMESILGRVKTINCGQNRWDRIRKGAVSVLYLFLSHVGFLTRQTCLIFKKKTNNLAVCINKIANSCREDDRDVSSVAQSPKEPKCCFHVFEIQFFVSARISCNRQGLRV